MPSASSNSGRAAALSRCSAIAIAVVSQAIPSAWSQPPCRNISTAREHLVAVDGATGKQHVGLGARNTPRLLVGADRVGDRPSQLELLDEKRSVEEGRREIHA